MTDRKFSIILIAAIVLGGGALVYFLFTGKEKPERVDQARLAPPVTVLAAKPETLTLTVDAQGSVVPRRQIDLVNQVGGRIVKIADSFFDGEFFAEGQTLIWIDERDFKNALTRAQADVASARQRLALEQAEADQAARDWELLGGEGEPSPLVLRKPQLAEAQAQLDAAQASLEDAKLNLERTQISVPFAGRVREKNVDIGQFVSPGQTLGTVYSTDVVEIRLPLTDRQASFLDLPLSPRQNMKPLPVTISATFTGQDITWDAVIRRTEGAIDPRSRVIVAVAEVADPFNLKPGADQAKAPLSVGLFVSAAIEGKTFSNVFRIPRNALRASNEVVVVDGRSRLIFKPVSILRTTPDFAYISKGLAAGDKVMLTQLDAPIGGMEVDVIETRGAATNSGSAAVSAGSSL
jgi:RND family efflux transporter MFP subunit